MRVLVVGATGVLGRALLPALQASGHSVIGMARTPDKLLMVDKLGAQAVRGDILDAQSMLQVVRDTQPEAIVNVATAIPLRLRLDPKDWERNDRIRVEGTANLLAAAREVSPRLLIQESVGYVCEAQGDRWIDENSKRSTHPFIRNTVHMEDLVTAAGLPAVLLRFGALNAPTSWHTQQTLTALRKGMLPVIGDGASYVSQIHAEDAAQAILKCLENPQAATGQTFHVVDNEPAPMRDVFPYAAKLLNAPVPRRVPAMMAKMVVGALTLEIFTASYRISNHKLRQTLGFVPRYPTYRETWNQIVGLIGGQDFSASQDLS